MSNWLKVMIILIDLLKIYIPFSLCVLFSFSIRVPSIHISKQSGQMSKLTKQKMSSSCHHHSVMDNKLKKLQFLILTLIFNRLQVTADNWCDLTCENNIQNSACDCVRGVECGRKYNGYDSDDAERVYILDIHNKVRQRVASGNEKVESRATGASNMMALNYDLNLEYVALCWVKKCVDGHDKCRRTKQFSQVGQNFYQGRRECKNKNVFKSAVDFWYKEVNKISNKCLKQYTTDCPGHFSQVIWAKTTHVGCARVEFSGKCNLVCNYGPAGNMLMGQVYKPGKGASECPDGLRPNSKYSALCGEVGISAGCRVAELSNFYSFIIVLLVMLLQIV